MSGFKRANRVASSLRRELGNFLMREDHGQLLLEVSFTDVQVSDDLRHAKVFYTFVGEEGPDQEKQTSITRLFQEISPRLQRYLGGVMQMKYTPRLKFYYDETLESARRIEAILDGLRDESGDGCGE